MIIRVHFRGYGNGTLVFEEQLEIDSLTVADVIEEIVERHVYALPRKHMIEIEFPDDPNPAERFYRIGTDIALMDRLRDQQ